MTTRDESGCPIVHVLAQIDGSTGSYNGLWDVYSDGVYMASFASRSQADAYARSLKGGC